MRASNTLAPEAFNYPSILSEEVRLKRLILIHLRITEKNFYRKILNRILITQWLVF